MMMLTFGWIYIPFYILVFVGLIVYGLVLGLWRWFRVRDAVITPDAVNEFNWRREQRVHAAIRRRDGKPPAGRDWYV